MYTDYIIYSFFALVLGCTAYYFIRYFSALCQKEQGNALERPGTMPLSVIIAARNEYENLQRYLHKVLEQDYPDFEVVLVNDCSFDQSSEYLKELALQQPRLKVVEIAEEEKYKHGKKFALTLGIKAAKHEHLVFTDADCEPASTKWLQHVAAGFAQNKEIVIGFSPEIKKKGLLNYFSGFETFYTALQYISFALRNQTYMGVGRNMAYTKTIFFKNKGFASHMHLLSGDDDLFINEVANADNVAVITNPDSFMLTSAMSTWSEYLVQKTRHYSVGKYYKSIDKWNLTFISLSGMLFYFGIVAAICLGISWQVLLGIYLGRLFFVMPFYYLSMKRLGLLELWLPSIALEPMFFIANPILSLVGIFARVRRWK